MALSPSKTGFAPILFIFYVIQRITAQDAGAAAASFNAHVIGGGTGERESDLPVNIGSPISAADASRNALIRRIAAGTKDFAVAEALNNSRLPVGQTASPVGSLAGLAGLSVNAIESRIASILTVSTARPLPTTTFAGFMVGSPYPFVLPPPDIPYFGSKWNGPWGYPIGHYQAFRGTGQYITHYNYYPLSYFGSLMAPFAFGMSGKK